VIPVASIREGLEIFAGAITEAAFGSESPQTAIRLNNPADTTRAIAWLHYGNTFARTPDVKYIFAHAGGTMPYLAGRFGIIDEMHVIPGAEGRATAAETFRRLYWDTALSWGDPVLRMLRDVVGIDRVLFGSDYPYLRRDLAVSCRSTSGPAPN
jgi:aminocarboxymuconate-semialdehyde decarboxylase